MRVLVMLCALASAALAEPKRLPFADLDVTPPPPRELPVKRAKPAKPAKPPTAAELAFAARRATCEEAVALARRVDRCVRSLTPVLQELDKNPAPAPLASEADRLTELAARPLDAKRDAETTALCARERTRLERIEKHACMSHPIGCTF